MTKKHLVSLLTITLVMALTCVFSEADEELAVAGKESVEWDGTYSCTASISLVKIIAGTLDQDEVKARSQALISEKCDSLQLVQGDEIPPGVYCRLEDSTLDGLESWSCIYRQGCLRGEDVVPCDPPYLDCSGDNDYTVADLEALDIIDMMMPDMM